MSRGGFLGEILLGIRRLKLRDVFNYCDVHCSDVKWIVIRYAAFSGGLRSYADLRHDGCSEPGSRFVIASERADPDVPEADGISVILQHKRTFRRVWNII